MGLDQVVQEVRDGAERQAKEILDAARAEADAILAKARDAAAAYEAGRMAQATRDAEQLQRQYLSNAKFEARKLVLSTENELRNELRTTLIEGLAGLGAAPRKKHLKALLARAAETVPSGKVWGNAKDAKELKASDYTYAGDVEIAGGLIVESDDGTVRLDLSYETLLDGLWRDVLKAESELFA